MARTVIMTSLFICLQLPARAGDRLEDEFKTPPQSAGLHAYWFWVDSNFSKEGITKDLEAMKSAGFGSALILNVGGGPENPPWPDQTYRSQKYFDALKHAAAEADRLGMTIGLNNGPGFDGTGGPWVQEKDNMRHLVWSRKDVEGPLKLKDTLPKPETPGAGAVFSKVAQKPTLYDDIAVLAVPEGKTIRPDQVMDLTGSMQPDGSLAWDVPPGKWSVYRIGYAPTMVGPHPVPSGVLGALEVDKMDREANLRHWQNVIDPLKRCLGSLYGKSFNRLHIDSYECGTQNWTKNFSKEFIRLKGYDPVPWLVTFGTPVLGFNDKQYNGGIMNGKPRGKDSRVIGNEDQTARFDWDFADVVNRLFTDNWLLARSLMAPDKVKFSFEPYKGPFNTIEGAAIADAPMATFWTTARTGDHNVDWGVTQMNGDGAVDVETPAGARAAGRTVINCESFTSLPNVSNWTEKPALLKRIADGAFASGVNQMTLHQWTLQPFDDKYQPGLNLHLWGVHFGRFQTWYEPGKAFFGYLNRCQSMLQQGEQVVDGLAIDTPHKRGDLCDLISSHDFLNDDTKVSGGKVCLSSGRSYEYITYPTNGVVLPEIASKLKNLMEQGATVVTGRFVTSPSLREYPACDKKIQEISKEVWDSGRYKDRVFLDTKTAAEHLGLKPDYEIKSSPQPGSVKVVHRRTRDADIYFVANRLDKPQNITVDFRVQGKQPELWQAEDLSINDAPVWNEQGGRTSVALSLGAHQTVFVVFRRPAGSADHPASLAAEDKDGRWSIGRDGGGRPVFRSPMKTSAKVVYASGKEKTVSTEAIPPVLLAGAWDVSFEPKLGEKFQLQFPELVDFSRHADPRVKYFAGTATYRKLIRISDDLLKSNRRILLDLGTMNDIASVRINGSAPRVAWYAPYQLDVTALLKAGDNQFEIAVTDNWANAIIGDEQLPADFETPGTEKRAKLPYGFQLPRFPGWFVKGQPRPSARRTFTTWNYYTKESTLKPAGLVGPVQLLVEQQSEL